MRLPKLTPGFLIGISFVLAVFFVGFISLVQTCARVPEKAIRGMGQASVEAVRTIFQAFQIQPQIRVDQKIVYQQTSAIAELAILSETGTFESRRENSWLYSTKKISLRGSYMVKAGFDLREPFLVQIDSRTGKILAKLPRAKILSLEPLGNLQFKGEQGWVNWLNDQDYEQALDHFMEETRRHFEQSDLLKRTEREALKRLEQLAARNGQAVDFSFATEPELN